MLLRFDRRALHTLSKFSRGYLDSSLTRILDVHPEVREALATKKPVVALETTLVTHGFPYPTNFNLSNSLENIVRSTGAIPATIGIVEGRIKIGLEQAELEQLANPPIPGSVVKISRRDIAPAVSMKAFGGTTCSATLIFAALAGIKVFATGGLGGVHRGGESCKYTTAMDISADLQELTRCPVGLVSSGAKSILDIGRTLEYLETLGVPVLSYGPSKQFPAFFTPKSGFEVPWSTESPHIAANILYTQAQLGMQNGALFAVPIPEKYEASGAEIQRAVDQAVAESEANGISKRGKEATPWLLSRVAELTKGTSMVSNIALLENNARIGKYTIFSYEKPHSSDTVSVYVSSPSTQPTQIPSSRANTEPTNTTQNDNASLLVLGAAAVDISARSSEVDSNSALGSTVPGTISLSLGGVARNIAEASHRVSPQDSVLLISSIGDDAFGHLLTKESENYGMRTDGLLLQKDQRTAVCNMIMDSQGGLTTGIADMSILDNAQIEAKAVDFVQKMKPKLVVMDGNCSSDVISTVATTCNEHDIKILILISEPTSVVKSSRILKAVENMTNRTSPIDFISPNLIELREIFETANEKDLLSKPQYWTALDNFALTSRYRMELEHLSRVNVSDEDTSRGTLSFLLDQGMAQMAVKLLPLFRHIVIKCGDKGVLVAMRQNPDSAWRSEQSNIKARCVVHHSDSDTIVLSHFPALPVEHLVNVTGAGDSFVGILASYLVRQPNAFNSPESLTQVIDVAQRAAVLTLGSPYAVAPELSRLRQPIGYI
ncbi:indigoidine synthase A-like protein [Lentinula raphanica]|nr:indigoidine synthase A-like protein [Lentinula raphanica]